MPIAPARCSRAISSTTGAGARGPAGRPPPGARPGAGGPGGPRPAALETAPVRAVPRRRGIRAAAILAVVARGDERLDAEAVADAGVRLGRAALAALAPTPA